MKNERNSVFETILSSLKTGKTSRKKIMNLRNVPAKK
tara:strand:- start:1290 stop:1400 length:111 start_codon:yes stop_codon:yes gene_type:complete